MLPPRNTPNIPSAPRHSHFLTGGAADFVNGTTIECDGGMLPGVLYDAGLKTITDLL